MITVQVGNVWSQLYPDAASASLLQYCLETKLKADIPNAKYLWAVKSGKSDGKAKLWDGLYDDRGNSIGVRVRTGLLGRLIDRMAQKGITWQHGGDFRTLPANPVLHSPRVKLRNYQHDASRLALTNESLQFGWWPSGVISIGTGGGKTELAVGMYEMNPVPSFFLVHRTHLMEQARERFERYGHDAGVIGDRKFDPKPFINIATIQTIHRALKDPISKKGALVTAMVDACQQVFFDECHIMASNEEKGNIFVGVADRFNAPFRWGLTATPFMRTKYDNMLLRGVTGGILYRKPLAELVEEGFLVPPKMFVMHVPGKMDLPRPKPKKGQKSIGNKTLSEYWRKVETLGIKNNEIRTNKIIEAIDEGPWPLLVLVKTTEQARFIQSLYEALGAYGELPYIFGKTSSKARKQAVQEMEAGTLKILMTSTIFDDGIDIGNLRTIVLAGGGKSDQALVQRIGRAVRRAPGKEGATIIDFADGHHKKLQEHAKQREDTFIAQGFEVEYETR